MNQVILIGNLTHDPVGKHTPSGKSVADFSIAVQRTFKNADGNYDADFVQCQAWEQTAKLVCGYFAKGSKIGVVGSLATDSYTDKDGNRRVKTYVRVNSIEFVTPKTAERAVESVAPKKIEPKTEDTGFEDFDMDDSMLPF